MTAAGAAPAADAASAGGDSRLTIWPKRWFYLAVAVAGISVARDVGLSWLHAAMSVGGVVLLVEGVLRQLCAGRLRSFEREVARAIQEGEPERLLPLYRGQRLLRLAGPRDQILGKLGLIYQQLGDHVAAERAYREALEEAAPKQVPLLTHRLADALYAGERWAEAERCYRASQDEERQQINAGVQARIARLIRQRDGDLAEAEQYLRRAVDVAKGRPGCGLFRCQLIELLVVARNQDEALWQLSIAEEELAGADESEQACLLDARTAVEGLASEDE